jgi:hypothetical protein
MYEQVRTCVQNARTIYRTCIFWHIMYIYTTRQVNSEKKIGNACTKNRTRVSDGD